MLSVELGFVDLAAYTEDYQY